MIVQSDGARMPFPDGWFASVVSTSVLEHIPHIDAVLAETARVIREGGSFVFCVPNHRFPESLLGTKLLNRIGLKGLARRYSLFFNRIARHAHTEPPEQWIERLTKAGFALERSWDYFSPRSLYVLETGHFFGLPAWLARKLTGRWILSKTHWNLWLAFRLTRPSLDRRLSPDGVCTFFIAKRVMVQVP
jgi:SAM-dependent methyltransferase